MTQNDCLVPPVAMSRVSWGQQFCGGSGPGVGSAATRRSGTPGGLPSKRREVCRYCRGLRRGFGSAGGNGPHGLYTDGGAMDVWGMRVGQWSLFRGWGVHTTPTPTPRDALEGKAPQRRPEERLDRRLEEVDKAVGGGYCRLQMPLKLALAIQMAVAGHRLGAVDVGGRGDLLPLPMHSCPPPPDPGVEQPPCRIAPVLLTFVVPPDNNNTHKHQRTPSPFLMAHPAPKQAATASRGTDIALGPTKPHRPPPIPPPTHTTHATNRHCSPSFPPLHQTAWAF